MCRRATSSPEHSSREEGASVERGRPSTTPHSAPVRAAPSIRPPVNAPIPTILAVDTVPPVRGRSPRSWRRRPRVQLARVHSSRPCGGQHTRSRARHARPARPAPASPPARQRQQSATRRARGRHQVRQIAVHPHPARPSRPAAPAPAYHRPPGRPRLRIPDRRPVPLTPTHHSPPPAPPEHRSTPDAAGPTDRIYAGQPLTATHWSTPRSEPAPPDHRRTERRPLPRRTRPITAAPSSSPPATTPPTEPDPCPRAPGTTASRPLTSRSRPARPGSPLPARCGSNSATAPGVPVVGLHPVEHVQRRDLRGNQQVVDGHESLVEVVCRYSPPLARQPAAPELYLSSAATCRPFPRHRVGGHTRTARPRARPPPLPGRTPALQHPHRAGRRSRCRPPGIGCRRLIPASSGSAVSTTISQARP